MVCQVLFIDDERDPHHPQVREQYPADAQFHVIRTLRGLRDWLAENPLPDIVSFDYHMHVTDQLRNGGDYAAYMAFELDLQDKIMPYVMVHSADPDAPKKILRQIQLVFPDFTWEENQKCAPSS